jgi:O-antigen biosynthesis protein
MVRRRHSWVTLIESGENLGFARANNIALSRVRGEFVLLLNPDTIVRHDTIATMLAFFRAHGDAGAAGCKVLNPDGSLQLACRRGFPTPGVAFFKLAGLAGLFPRSRTFGAYNMTYLDPEYAAEVDAVSGSFLMVRKKVLETIGFLDDAFFMYGEDLDFCYRIKQSGWKIYYVPDTEIIHFKGESTRNVPNLKSLRDFYTAMHIFVRKHYSGPLWLFPRGLVVAGIYINMGLSMIRNACSVLRLPALDLCLLNLSLVISILLRFGRFLEFAPSYSGIQWLSVFVVYSAIYMTTFYAMGLFHHNRYNPERTITAVFIAFLFNVFIVNFVKDYNFSRIASFYCWGFNTLFISGWRFVCASITEQNRDITRRKALVVGTLDSAVALKNIMERRDQNGYAITGALAIDPDALRGAERDGVHVLGLLDDLQTVIREYTIDVVFMVGHDIPFSKILTNGSRHGLRSPEFKFIPELRESETMDENGTNAIPMIDIHAGRLFGSLRRN